MIELVSIDTPKAGTLRRASLTRRLQLHAHQRIWEIGGTHPGAQVRYLLEPTGIRVWGEDGTPLDATEIIVSANGCTFGCLTPGVPYRRTCMRRPTLLASQRTSADPTCGCPCHRHPGEQPPHVAPTPPTGPAVELAGVISLALDAAEDATPTDLRHPAYGMWQVVQAYLKDAHDALRVLAGEMTPDDPDWDIMPDDVVEAARALFPVAPPQEIRDSSTSVRPSPRGGEVADGT